ncbi:hypothetical protein, partial [Caballeronia mineralivorans]|uniref:hypothetical protein n=1 Tax=Caballeronia mineralivorans TaxID=2010198 RepID=UPI0023F41AFF
VTELCACESAGAITSMPVAPASTTRFIVVLLFQVVLTNFPTPILGFRDARLNDEFKLRNTDDHDL